MNDLIAAALRGIDIAVENMALAQARVEKSSPHVRTTADRAIIVYLADCIVDASKLYERLAQLAGEDR